MKKGCEFSRTLIKICYNRCTTHVLQLLKDTFIDETNAHDIQHEQGRAR